MSIEGIPPGASQESERGMEQGGSRHTASYDGKLYDVIALMRLAEEMPEATISAEGLNHMKDGNYWHSVNGEMIGPKHVMDALWDADGDWEAASSSHPDLAKQIQAVRTADYNKYPLLLVEGESEKPWVIDGMHRLTHAWIDGVQTLKSKQFKKLPAEAVIRNVGDENKD